MALRSAELSVFSFLYILPTKRKELRGYPTLKLRDAEFDKGKFLLSLPAFDFCFTSTCLF